MPLGFVRAGAQAPARSGTLLRHEKLLVHRFPALGSALPGGLRCLVVDTVCPRSVSQVSRECSHSLTIPSYYGLLLSNSQRQGTHAGLFAVPNALYVRREAVSSSFCSSSLTYLRRPMACPLQDRPHSPVPFASSHRELQGEYTELILPTCSFPRLLVNGLIWRLPRRRRHLPAHAATDPFRPTIQCTGERGIGCC
jgi:hypothetical protein